jgi:uncharacterized membrane protein
MAWVIILALFALPVGLPVLLTLVMVPFTLFVSLGAVLIAFVAVGFAVFVAGGISLLVTPFTLFADISFGLLTGGIGLVFLGIGILLARLVPVIMDGFGAVARLVARKIRRFQHGRVPAEQ